MLYERDKLMKNQIGMKVFGGEFAKPHLQLILGGIALLGLGCLDGLHHTKAGSLDFSLGVLLRLHELLVLVLQLLDLGFEGLLGFLKKLGLLRNRGIQVFGAHFHHLVDLCLLLVVAQIDVGRRAHGLEVLRREFLQVGKPTASAVVLKRTWVSVLKSRETFDSVGVAEGFAGGGAVNIGNKSIRSKIFLHKFVPIRFHFLAVSSPRSEEFNENSLPGGCFVPVVWC